MKQELEAYLFFFEGRIGSLSIIIVTCFNYQLLGVYSNF